MSLHHRSLALEEIQGSVDDLKDLFHERHLSINASAEAQPACQVVKVSGSITVSF